MALFRTPVAWRRPHAADVAATLTPVARAVLVVRLLDSPTQARQRAEALGKIVGVSGIRIVTMHPAVLRVPVLGALTERLEWSLMRTPLKRFAGFVVMTVQKP